MVIGYNPVYTSKLKGKNVRYKWNWPEEQDHEERYITIWGTQRPPTYLAPPQKWKQVGGGTHLNLIALQSFKFKNPNNSANASVVRKPKQPHSEETPKNPKG